LLGAWKGDTRPGVLVDANAHWSRIHTFAKQKTKKCRFFIDKGAAHASINGLIAGKFKQGDFFGEIAFVAMCKKVLGDKEDKASHSLTLRQADVVRLSSLCQWDTWASFLSSSPFLQL
jgi:hypothetical protein